MGSLHCVNGLYMGVRWQLETLETRSSDASASSGSLTRTRESVKSLFTSNCKIHSEILKHLSLEMVSLSGWFAGVGEDAASLGSSAGERLVGLVVANSNTNWSMSARGYLVGPEP